VDRRPDPFVAYPSLSLGASLDYALSGRQAPECLRPNVAGIYENLKWFVLPDGGFVYPNGQDWQLFRNADWAGAHFQMAVFGRDPNAWVLACRSLDTLEKMQARFDMADLEDRRPHRASAVRPAGSTQAG
jgi:hypothetical protein